MYSPSLVCGINVCLVQLQGMHLHTGKRLLKTGQDIRGGFRRGGGECAAEGRAPFSLCSITRASVTN